MAIEKKRHVSFSEIKDSTDPVLQEALTKIKANVFRKQIVSGDNMSGIAREYKISNWQRLVEFNQILGNEITPVFRKGEMISAKLKIGQFLYIPKDIDLFNDFVKNTLGKVIYAVDLNQKAENITIPEVKSELEREFRNTEMSLYPTARTSIGVDAMSQAYIGAQKSQLFPDLPTLFIATKAQCARYIRTYERSTSNPKDLSPEEREYLAKENIDAWEIPEELLKLGKTDPEKGFFQRKNLMGNFSRSRIGSENPIIDDKKFNKDVLDLAQTLRTASVGTLVPLYYKHSSAFKWMKPYNAGRSPERQHLNTHQVKKLGYDFIEFKASEFKTIRNGKEASFVDNTLSLEKELSTLKTSADNKKSIFETSRSSLEGYVLGLRNKYLDPLDQKIGAVFSSITTDPSELQEINENLDKGNYQAILDKYSLPEVNEKTVKKALKELETLGTKKAKNETGFAKIKDHFSSAVIGKKLNLYSSSDEKIIKSVDKYNTLTDRLLGYKKSLDETGKKYNNESNKRNGIILDLASKLSKSGLSMEEISGYMSEGNYDEIWNFIDQNVTDPKEKAGFLKTFNSFKKNCIEWEIYENVSNTIAFDLSKDPLQKIDISTYQEIDAPASFIKLLNSFNNSIENIEKQKQLLVNSSEERYLQASGDLDTKIDTIMAVLTSDHNDQIWIKEMILKGNFDAVNKKYIDKIRLSSERKVLMKDFIESVTKWDKIYGDSETLLKDIKEEPSKKINAAAYTVFAVDETFKKMTSIYNQGFEAYSSDLKKFNSKSEELKKRKSISIVELVADFVRIRGDHYDRAHNQVYTSMDIILKGLITYGSTAEIYVDGEKIDIAEQAAIYKKNPSSSKLINADSKVTLGGDMMLDGYVQWNHPDPSKKGFMNGRTRFFWEFLVDGDYLPTELLEPGKNSSLGEKIKSNFQTKGVYSVRAGETDINTAIKENLIIFEKEKFAGLQEGSEEYNKLFKKLFELQVMVMQIKGFSRRIYADFPIPWFDVSDESFVRSEHQKYMKQKEVELIEKAKQFGGVKKIVEFYTFSGDNYSTIVGRLANIIDGYSSQFEKYPHLKELGSFNDFQKRMFIEHFFGKLLIQGKVRKDNQNIPLNTAEQILEGKVKPFDRMWIKVEDLNEIIQQISQYSNFRFEKEGDITDIDNTFISALALNSENKNLIKNILFRESYGGYKRKFAKWLVSHIQEIKDDPVRFAAFQKDTLKYIKDYFNENKDKLIAAYGPDILTLIKSHREDFVEKYMPMMISFIQNHKDQYIKDYGPAALQYLEKNKDDLISKHGNQIFGFVVKHKDDFIKFFGADVFGYIYNYFDSKKSDLESSVLSYVKSHKDENFTELESYLRTNKDVISKDYGTVLVEYLKKNPGETDKVISFVIEYFKANKDDIEKILLPILVNYAKSHKKDIQEKYIPLLIDYTKNNKEFLSKEILPIVLEYIKSNPELIKDGAVYLKKYISENKNEIFEKYGDEIISLIINNEQKIAAKLGTAASFVFTRTISALGATVGGNNVLQTLDKFGIIDIAIDVVIDNIKSKDTQTLVNMISKRIDDKLLDKIGTIAKSKVTDENIDKYAKLALTQLNDQNVEKLSKILKEKLTVENVEKLYKFCKEHLNNDSIDLVISFVKPYITDENIKEISQFILKYATDENIVKLAAILKHEFKSLITDQNIDIFFGKLNLNISDEYKLQIKSLIKEVFSSDKNIDLFVKFALSHLNSANIKEFLSKTDSKAITGNIDQLSDFIKKSLNSEPVDFIVSILKSYITDESIDNLYKFILQNITQENIKTAQDFLKTELTPERIILLKEKIKTFLADQNIDKLLSMWKHDLSDSHKLFLKKVFNMFATDDNIDKFIKMLSSDISKQSLENVFLDILKNIPSSDLSELWKIFKTDITNKDIEKLYGILISKLSSLDTNKLSQTIKSHITDHNIDKAYQLIVENLTSANIDKLFEELAPFLSKIDLSSIINSLSSGKISSIGDLQLRLIDMKFFGKNTKESIDLQKGHWLNRESILNALESLNNPKIKAVIDQYGTKEDFENVSKIRNILSKSENELTSQDWNEIYSIFVKIIRMDYSIEEFAQDFSGKPRNKQHIPENVVGKAISITLLENKINGHWIHVDGWLDRIGEKFDTFIDNPKKIESMEKIIVMINNRGESDVLYAMTENYILRAANSLFGNIKTSSVLLQGEKTDALKDIEKYMSGSITQKELEQSLKTLANSELGKMNYSRDVFKTHLKDYISTIKASNTSLTQQQSEFLSKLSRLSETLEHTNTPVNTIFAFLNHKSSVGDFNISDYLRSVGLSDSILPEENEFTGSDMQKSYFNYINKIS